MVTVVVCAAFAGPVRVVGIAAAKENANNSIRANRCRNFVEIMNFNSYL